MKDKDISFDKYYTLDIEQKYFSIDLQRKVKFDGVLDIKPTHCSSCGTWFGKLIDVDINGLKDYVNYNEIEFITDNIIGEYEFKDKLPLDYIMPLNLV